MFLLVLVYVFNFNLFEFSAAILEKGQLQSVVMQSQSTHNMAFGTQIGNRSIAQSRTSTGNKNITAHLFSDH